MTRYSTSRGMMYTAPPAEDDAEEDPLGAEADADADVAPTPADD